MKVRTDFVTNSSSSSFILAFENENQIEEVRNELPSHWSEETFEKIIGDIKGGIISIEQVLERYRGKGCFWAYDRKNNFYHDESAENEFIEKVKQHSNSIFSEVTYSDNGGGMLGSELEHKVMPYLKYTLKRFSYR